MDTAILSGIMDIGYGNSGRNREFGNSVTITGLVDPRMDHGFINQGLNHGFENLRNKAF